MRGSIKFFAQDKGFGFILPDDASGDVFFHHTALANAGKRSMTVHFLSCAIPLPRVCASLAA
jgi:cold shock CspA family protein